jgi:hypothetical protein
LNPVCNRQAQRHKGDKVAFVVAFFERQKGTKEAKLLLLWRFLKDKGIKKVKVK